MTLPKDVDLTKLSDTYVAGALRNEQSHIDYLDTAIKALQAQQVQHMLESELYFDELCRRGIEPYHTYLAKFEIAEGDERTYVNVPRSVFEGDVQTVGEYINGALMKQYGDKYVYLRNFYECH